MFEDLFPADLTGDIHLHVLDPNGITPPQAIIQSDDDWSVRADWFIDDAAAPLLGGDWTLHVYFESMGGGPEGALGSMNVPLNAAPPLPLPRNYSATINVTAGTLPAGVYKLVAVLNYANMGVKQEIAGFTEGPMIQVYDV